MPDQLNITNIPSNRIEFIDPRTGLVSREWYRFFLNLFNLAGAGSNQVSLDELQIGPPPQPDSGGGGGGSGTVTSVDTGTGLTGGPITTTGTVSFAVPAVGTWAATPSSANLAAAMTDETGSGALVFGTSPTLSGPTIDGVNPYINITPASAPTYQEGRLFYDSTAKTLNYYNDNSQMSVNIAQEQIVRVRNQTGSTIPDGSVVYVSGATGNTPTIDLAIATSFTTSDIIGVTTTSIANNGFGYVTISGLVNGLDTSAFTEGQAVFLSPTTAGAYTATEPNSPNYSVQVGVILRANPSVGTLLVAVQFISTESSHIVGSITNSQLANSSITINGSPISLGGSVSVGTVTSVTGTSPVVSSGGATPAISLDTAYGDTQNPYASKTANYFLAAPNGSAGTPTFRGIVAADIPALSYVSSIGVTAPITSTGGLTPTIGITQSGAASDGYLSSTDWNTFNNKQAAGTYVTSVAVASSNGFAGSSSGGATPTLTLSTSITGLLKGNGTAMSAATSGTDYSAGTSALATGILKSTTGTGALTIAVAADFPTLNQNTTGTAAGLSSTLAIASGGTGQTTQTAAFDALAPTTTKGDLIVSNGTDNIRLGVGTDAYVLTADSAAASGVKWAAAAGGGSNITSQGMWENALTISSNYSVTSGNSAMSAGPITIAAGVSVTVPSGSRWVVV